MGKYNNMTGALKENTKGSRETFGKPIEFQQKLL